MAGRDLDEDARFAFGNLTQRMMDPHRQTAKPLRRFEGEFSKNLFGHGLIGLIAQTFQFAMIGVRFRSGSTEKDTFSPRRLGKRYKGASLHGVIQDLHFDLW